MLILSQKNATFLSYHLVHLYVGAFCICFVVAEGLHQLKSCFGGLERSRQHESDNNQRMRSLTMAASG